MTQNTCETTPNPEDFFKALDQCYKACKDEMIRMFSEETKEERAKEPSESMKFRYFCFEIYEKLTNCIDEIRKTQKEVIVDWMFDRARSRDIVELQQFPLIDWYYLERKFAPQFKDDDLEMEELTPVMETLAQVINHFVLNPVSKTPGSGDLPAAHVEVDVTSFARSRKKVQLSTRDGILQCTLDPLLFYTVLMSPVIGRKV